MMWTFKKTPFYFFSRCLPAIFMQLNRRCLEEDDVLSPSSAASLKRQLHLRYVWQWRFYVWARGTGPQILPRPPKFFSG